MYAIHVPTARQTRRYSGMPYGCRRDVGRRCVGTICACTTGQGTFYPLWNVHWVIFTLLTLAQSLHMQMVCQRVWHGCCICNGCANVHGVLFGMEHGAHGGMGFAYCQYFDVEIGSNVCCKQTAGGIVKVGGGERAQKSLKPVFGFPRLPLLGAPLRPMALPLALSVKRTNPAPGGMPLAHGVGVC